MEAAREAKKEIRELRNAMPKIAQFFKPMGGPQAGDWLASHKEPGQTFEEYLDSNPTKPTAERSKLYIQPLGTFERDQRQIVDAAGDFLAAFYDLEVIKLPEKKLLATSTNVRKNDARQSRQFKTGYILNAVLKPALPADAAVLIAFTNEDLYPDESMNYVFGQASLDDRVGVWSLARLDDNTSRQNFLIRTLKIATHETGHMVSMRHCTKYECLMSGTNHLQETDRRPVDACPECTAKVCWISDARIDERYKKLANVCRRIGLDTEAEQFTRKSAAVFVD